MKIKLDIELEKLKGIQQKALEKQEEGNDRKAEIDEIRKQK